MSEVKIEVWYSPKYSEFVLREFDKWDNLHAFEWDDDFSIELFNFVKPFYWEYWGKL